MTRSLWLLLMAVQLAGLILIFGTDAVTTRQEGVSPGEWAGLKGLFEPHGATATFVALPQQRIVMHFSVMRCKSGCKGGAAFSIEVHGQGTSAMRTNPS